MLVNYDDDHMNIAVTTEGEDGMNCCTDDVFSSFLNSLINEDMFNCQNQQINGVRAVESDIDASCTELTIFNYKVVKVQALETASCKNARWTTLLDVLLMFLKSLILQIKEILRSLAARIFLGEQRGHDNSNFSET
ncbi:hypothetical protein BC332_31781 [Capsicum chinense]|nr:hypothetical protein BC332_31781 [Capsicum chinense]